MRPPRPDAGSKRPLEVWAGAECSLVRVGEAYRDSLARSGHLVREGDISLLAALGVKAVRFPILWESTAPDKLEQADWRWADRGLRELREHGIRPIVGLVHHGSGPRQTSLLDKSFATGLAAFAGAVAKRYPWIGGFTPINEPLTTARFSGLYGHWYPHARSAAAFLRALLVQCRAVQLAMESIREHSPDAQLVQTEDFARASSTPALGHQATFENERRWLSLDLLVGAVGHEHALYRYLRENEVTEDDLLPFRQRPCWPDLIGLNYYVTSERWLDERIERYPRSAVGGNGRDVYADVEAARASPEPIAGFDGALAATWDRYHLPLVLTEVHLGCSREEQVRWWNEAWSAAVAARGRGIDVRAVTTWAAFGSHDWNSLLVAESNHYEPGAFDVRSTPPRATAVASAVAACATGGAFTHPVLDSPGWWRRPRRFAYGAPPLSRPFVAGEASPILIAGGSGRLAQAFARACSDRGLANVLASRAELDITEESSVATALNVHRPWAVVNAAGYTRVDDAELDRGACWRENVVGPDVLAMECAKRQVQLVTFSSAMVFDGQSRAPYVERDALAPLNTYGVSKAVSDRSMLQAHPETLVIRSSPFFGSGDERSFVSRAVRALAARQSFAAAQDLVVSLTYLPDLVRTVVDLLVDGEHGLWHLANDGAVSWAELARLAARIHGVSSETLVVVDASALPRRAPRPPYSVLGTERGASLRPLDSALADYAHDSQ